jgi:hypothetical protein
VAGVDRFLGEVVAVFAHLTGQLGLCGVGDGVVAGSDEQDGQVEVAVVDR